MAIWDKLRSEIDRAGRAAQGALDEGKVRLELFRARQSANRAAQTLGYAVHRARVDGSAFGARAAREVLEAHFRGTSLDGLGVAALTSWLQAAGAAGGSSSRATSRGCAADPVPEVPGEGDCVGPGCPMSRAATTATPTTTPSTMRRRSEMSPAGPDRITFWALAPPRGQVRTARST